MKYLVLDIETTGLNPWFGDEVTCICAKAVDLDNKIVHSFKKVRESGIEEIKFINDFLKWFEDFKGHELVSKNGKAFDFPFLFVRSERSLNNESSWIFKFAIHRDLQELTHKWIGLNDMAALLGVGKKSGNGLKAIQLWKNQQLAYLLKYCWDDVLLTEKVFLKVMELRGDKV